jgi:hypothetical protein
MPRTLVVSQGLPRVSPHLTAALRDIAVLLLLTLQLVALPRPEAS